MARTYYTARALAAAVSIASLWLVWLIGSRWLSPRADPLATFLLAAAAIRQAHFMTVDGSSRSADPTLSAELSERTDLQPAAR